MCILCAQPYNEQVITVQVSGPWTYKVVSRHPNVDFVNVRFEIGAGAKYILKLDDTATFSEMNYTVKTLDSYQMCGSMVLKVPARTTIMFVKRIALHFPR